MDTATKHPGKTADWATDTAAGLPPLATVDEVSAVLRMHPRTCKRRIAAGRLKAIRSRIAGSSRVLVARAAVAAYLASLA